MSYDIWLCSKRIIFFSISQICHFWNKVCGKKGFFLSHCVLPSLTYRLLLYIVVAPTQTFFVSGYQLNNTLVTENSRPCIQPVLSAALVWSSLFVPICCPPRHRFIRGERWKSEGATSGLYGGDQTLPIENDAGTSLLLLQSAGEHCH